MNKIKLLTALPLTKNTLPLDVSQMIRKVYGEKWQTYKWSNTEVNWLNECTRFLYSYLQEEYKDADELTQKYDQSVKQLIMLSLLMVEKMLRDLE